MLFCLCKQIFYAEAKALMQKFLDIMGYNVKNSKGDTCFGVNTIDLLSLIAYLVLVLISLWKNTTETLSYFATVFVSVRAFLKYLTRQIKVKKNGDDIAIAHIISISVYAVVFVVMIMFYFLSNEETVKNTVITFYYFIFAFFEFVDILARYYDAEPRIYHKNH